MTMDEADRIISRQRLAYIRDLEMVAKQDLSKWSEQEQEMIRQALAAINAKVGE